MGKKIVQHEKKNQVVKYALYDDCVKCQGQCDNGKFYLKKFKQGVPQYGTVCRKDWLK